MDPTDPRLLKVIRGVLRRAGWVEALAFSRGVQRFRSIEEADEQREHLMKERVGRLRARRHTEGTE